MILLKDISTIINAEKVSLLLYYIVNYVILEHILVNANYLYWILY